MRTLISPLIALGLAITIAPAVVSLRAQSPADTHLGNAKAILASIPVEAELVTRDKKANEKAADEVARLRRQFADLVTGYEASRGAMGSELDWKLKFSEVERTLVRIVGGGSSLGPTRVGAQVVVQPVGTSGVTPSRTDAVEVPAGGVPTAAVGTTGTASTAKPVGDANLAAGAAKVSTLGIRDLNPEIRRQLQAFRTELELLYVAPVGERGDSR